MIRPQLTIQPDTADKVQDGWQVFRQRDYTGGENLSDLPEAIPRNNLILAENCLISPQGLLTDSWQIDKKAIDGMVTGMVLVPIANSDKYRLYTALDDKIVSFIVDFKASTIYHVWDADIYPGYTTNTHSSDVTFYGMTYGVPFLGKHYCCAWLENGLGLVTITPSPIAFGDVAVGEIKVLTVTIENPIENTDPIIVASVFVRGTDAVMFGKTKTLMVANLNPGQSTTLEVIFSPTSQGAKTATLVFFSNSGMVTAEITGTGT